jgi:hypothetical protein
MRMMYLLIRKKHKPELFLNARKHKLRKEHMLVQKKIVMEKVMTFLPKVDLPRKLEGPLSLLQPNKLN